MQSSSFFSTKIQFVLALEVNDRLVFSMTSLKLHSKLISLQGQIISAVERELVLTQMRAILFLRNAGRISISEAGARIRKTAWKIAEDLRLNELQLTTGSDQHLLEKLPKILN